MIKASKEVLILWAGLGIGTALTAAGFNNGLRLSSPYRSEPVEAAADLADNAKQEVARLEKQKEELESQLGKKEAEAAALQHELDEKEALYAEASSELNDLEDYKEALLNMEEYIRPLKLVADMTIYWGYDFERAGELSSDTNLMNSLNGMFGNIITNLFVKDVNDNKNKLLDTVVQFNQAVEPYVSSNMKLIEDAKKIVREIEFCSYILECPENPNELLMNLRIVKKRYRGLPTQEFYDQRMKELLPGLMQGRMQFQLILDAYKFAFLNPKSDGVRSMEHTVHYFQQAVDAYWGDYGTEWYSHCEEVGQENNYPITMAYKDLIDGCMENKKEMQELQTEVFHMSNNTYGDCNVTVYYKNIDSENKFLCVEDTAATGEKLGRFYYGFDGWPFYYHSFLDGEEAYFTLAKSDGYLGDKLIKEDDPRHKTLMSYLRIADNIRYLQLSNRELFASWYQEERFLIE